MSNLEVIKVITKPGVKKRAVGYARVSTADAMQSSSYKLQIQELENDIRENSEYQFIGIFKDRKSAASIKKRQEFNTMISLALMGEIDVIITKSITRFARNLVDTISTVRELKINNVEVFFQKEGISTLDPSIELILTILAMHAEEELRNISENSTWSYERKMRNGGNFTTYLYGYEIKGEEWNIIPSEAKVIKLIFDMYLNKNTYKDIIKKLARLGIKSPRGNDFWHHGSIAEMLQNEKYAGHMSLGKTFTHNGISLRTRRMEDLKNIILNHHEPIISQTTFDKAIALRNSRTKNSIEGYIPQIKRVTQYSKFVYSVMNESYLKYVVERPKGRYVIPTLYCYNRDNKNRIMVTVKNLYAILNDALITLSKSLINVGDVFSPLIKERLKKVEKDIKTGTTNKIDLLNNKVILLEGLRKCLNFNRRIKNYKELTTIEEFKALVRGVDILEDGSFKIKLSLLETDILDYPLLHSSINLRVGNGNKDIVFFIFI